MLVEPPFARWHCANYAWYLPFAKRSTGRKIILFARDESFLGLGRKKRPISTWTDRKSMAALADAGCVAFVTGNVY